MKNLTPVRKKSNHARTGVVLTGSLQRSYAARVFARTPLMSRPKYTVVAALGYGLSYLNEEVLSKTWEAIPPPVEALTPVVSNLDVPVARSINVQVEGQVKGITFTPTGFHRDVEVAK